MENRRPLEISCIDIDGLRAQMAEYGDVLVSNRREITRARKAIINTIAPDHLIRLESPIPGFSTDVPVTEEPFLQEVMRQAREVARFSKCMWRQVGCVLADPKTEEILLRTHNDSVGEGDFCSTLGLDYPKLRPLLEEGERLEFCTARHAENAMGEAARMMDTSDKIIGVSVDPCDHCAYTLYGMRPQGVYIDLNPAVKYYDTLGIKILQRAGIPVNFVRMPERK